jgi:hypothetical protein
MRKKKGLERNPKKKNSRRKPLPETYKKIKKDITKKKQRGGARSNPRLAAAIPFPPAFSSLLPWSQTSHTFHHLQPHFLPSLPTEASTITEFVSSPVGDFLLLNYLHRHAAITLACILVYIVMHHVKSTHLTT